MAQIRIERVNALPAVLTGSTMYVVKAANAAMAELVFTNTDGSVARHVINQADVSAMITTAISNLQDIVVVANIAARNAAVPTRNELVLVLDATGDSTVTAGAALYVYEVASASWFKVADYQSLDVVLTWTSIMGRPASTPAAIDDAVNKAHTHANKAVLDAVSDSGGQLAYNGVVVSNYVANAEW